MEHDETAEGEYARLARAQVVASGIDPEGYAKQQAREDAYEKRENDRYVEERRTNRMVVALQLAIQVGPAADAEILARAEAFAAFLGECEQETAR